MAYYHVRYSILPQAGSTEEKEEWINTEEDVNGDELKDLLIRSNRCDISLILCLQTTREDYDCRRLWPPVALTQNEVDENSLSFWNSDERSRTNKKMRDDSSKTEDRFRNVDDPGPLL